MHDSLYGVVVDDAELPAVDDHAGTGIGASQDKISFLAPRASRKAFFIGITLVAHLDDEQDNSCLLLDPFGVIGLDDAAIELFFYMRDCT